MLHKKTHVFIDGKLHKVHELEEQDGARHTHRVHLACGLTVDVDHNGAKHDAVASQHRVDAAAATLRKDTGHAHAFLEHAKHAEAHARKHRDDVNGPDSRWRVHAEAAADCAECARVEAGEERATFETGFNPPAEKASET